MNTNDASRRANSPAGTCCSIMLGLLRRDHRGQPDDGRRSPARSWTGLVVENTYVASQQFNAQGRGRARAGGARLDRRPRRSPAARSATGLSDRGRQAGRAARRQGAVSPAGLRGGGRDRSRWRRPGEELCGAASRPATASGSSKSTPMPVLTAPYRDVRRIMILPMERCNELLRAGNRAGA